MNVNSLCILRLSAIGDVCHAVAMVERIQRHSPGVEITWVIGKVEHQMIKHMPGVRFVIFDKSKGVSAYFDLWRTIRKTKFDVLFAMQVAFRANLAAGVIRARVKVGFDWNRSKELHWLFTNRRISAQHHPHVLDGFMAFAEAIGIPHRLPVDYQMQVPDEIEIWTRQMLQGLENYAVIVPGASNPERNWLPMRYAEVVDHISSMGLKVVICGGPSEIEAELGVKIEHLSRRVTRNLIGQTTLQQMLAILKGARIVVAPDTGPAHMATMMGTDVVGLYAHSNPLRTGPFNNLDDVVSVYERAVRQQHSQEWQQMKWGTRAKGKNLMSLIETKEVFSKIDNILERQET